MALGGFHGHLIRRLVLFLHGGPPFVPVVLKRQGDEAQADTNSDDEEHATNVLYADAIALVLYLRTFLAIVVPPKCL